jgi:DNA-binding beta-propeller fold protein YncE
VLLLPSSLRAAPLGALAQLRGADGCVSKLGTAEGCSEGGPALNGTSIVVVSPDGRNAYAASGLGSIVVFERNQRTGALTPTGCLADPIASLPCTSVPALAGTLDVAVSPDGTSIYAASSFSDAVVALSRDPRSGALSNLGCVSASHPACVAGLALDGARDVAVSPDGRTVYVGSFVDGAVASFERDPTTGRLTQLPGLDACVSFDSTLGVCDLAPGLQGVDDLVVGPEGTAVYAVAHGGNALVSLVRTPTGALGGALCFQGSLPLAPGCSLAPGLLGPYDLALSPDGRNLYVVGGAGIVLFQRDPSTGALSQLPGLLGCLGPTLPICQPIAGLGSAYSLVISPDGRSLYVSSGVLASGVPSSILVILARDPATGRLTTEPGESGCVSQGLAGCTPARPLDGALDTSLSPDGRHAYVAADFSSAVLVFSRTGADEAGPVVGLASRAVRVATDGIVRLRLSCPAEAGVCHGAISLRAKGRVIGRGTFAVAGGTAGPAEVRLSKRGRALLAARGRLSTAVTVFARDAQGLGHTTRGTITILAA